MKKALTLLALAAAAAGVAQAGTYSLRQESSCPIVTGGELAQAIQQAGKSHNLNLPKDMALRGELHCTAEGKRYVYSFRASIERQVSDGEQVRWAPVAHVTGYGSTPNRAALLRQVTFTVGDVIRQEP
jgi:hypothetical protein